MIFGQYLMRTVGVTDVRQTRTVTCLRARTVGNDHISFASIACFLAAIWTLWRNGWEESLYIYTHVSIRVCFPLKTHCVWVASLDYQRGVQGKPCAVGCFFFSHPIYTTFHHANKRTAPGRKPHEFKSSVPSANENQTWLSCFVHPDCPIYIPYGPTAAMNLVYGSRLPQDPQNWSKFDQLHIISILCQLDISHSCGWILVINRVRQLEKSGHQWVSYG